MDKQQRAEFIRRASFISEADRDMRAAFVDEIAQAAAPQPPSASDEYRRGLFEAFHLANMTNANRQGRTAEETCSQLVRCLAQLANGLGDTALAPSPAASADEWMAEASRLAEMVLDISVRDPGVGQMVRINKAARKLLAHLKERP